MSPFKNFEEEIIVIVLKWFHGPHYLNVTLFADTDGAEAVSLLKYGHFCVVGYNEKN